MPPRCKLTLQCTLTTFCLFSPWLCTILKAHIQNSDIYLDIHILFNISCPCKRESEKWFFLSILFYKIYIKQTLIKVKFQKNVSCFRSKPVQISILWDIHYLYDIMQVEFHTQKVQNSLALNKCTRHWKRFLMKTGIWFLHGQKIGFSMNFEKEKKRVTPLSFLQNRQNNLWGFIVTVMGTEIRQYFHTVMPRNSDCLHIPNLFYK